MSDSGRKIFMASKDSKSTEIINVSRGISSDVPVKTSLLSRVDHPWLTIAISLIAVGGIVGTIGIAVTKFVILRPTTSTTTTSTSTTSTSTTTPIMCYSPPSPRRSNIWLSVANMTVTRAYHTSTLVSQDNSILITGGYNGGPQFSVDRYISSTGCFQSMRNLQKARYYHSADQLSSLFGYVVVAGGYGVGGAIDSVELYHPLTGNILTMPLSEPRYQHTSIVFSSSQIVLIGGLTALSVGLDSADVLNTGTNSSFVLATNTMSETRVFHTSTLLGNTSNVVLITGGRQVSPYLSSSVLYHGTSNTFIALGSGGIMSSPRAYHTATYLPLPTHKVLITGGRETWILHKTMALFDINTLTFTTLNSTMAVPRHMHTATALPNGKVLLIGGHDGSNALKTCEVVDPFNNYSVTFVANLTTERYFHTATYIPDSNNGSILVCGGLVATNVYVRTCEVYFI